MKKSHFGAEFKSISLDLDLFKQFADFAVNELMNSIAFGCINPKLVSRVHLRGPS